MDRRLFIASSATVASAALAGCTDRLPIIGGDDEENGEEEEENGDEHNGDEENGDEENMYTVSVGDEISYGVMGENELEESMQNGQELANTGLNISVSVTESEVSEDSPAVIEFEVENTSPSQVVVEGMPPQPFGMVNIVDEDDSESELALWNDNYPGVDDPETFFEDADDFGDGVLEEESFTISSGQTLTRSYELFESKPDFDTGEFEYLSMITPHGEGTHLLSGQVTIE